MESDEEPPRHLPQCPVGSSLGRRNMKVKSEESSDERVELMVALKTSKPKVSIKVSSCVYEDSEACVCKNGLFDSPSSRRLSPGTAAAQTQMPSTKPKARTLVACRQLIDGNEAASLRDRSPLSSLPSKGAVTFASTDSKRTSSDPTSITHHETMQHSIWGMLGNGAPNYHKGTVKRTKNLYSAGILPQEQVRDKGFSGTPFHLL